MIIPWTFVNVPLKRQKARIGQTAQNTTSLVLNIILLLNTSEMASSYLGNHNNS